MIFIVSRLVRLLPFSRTSWCTLGWSIARTNDATPLALGDGLPLHLAKLNMFVFKCYVLVQKLLEIWEGVRHQLILEWPNESLHELFLLPLIFSNLLRSIPWQLNEFISIFTHCHIPLLEGEEFLLLDLHQPSKNMIIPKISGKLCPCDEVNDGVTNTIRIPSVCSEANEATRCIEDLLPVGALSDVKHFIHYLQSIICLKWIWRAGEGGWLMTHELQVLIPVWSWWWWRWWLLSILADLSLHLCHGVSHLL
jgi:hypothetical protein